MNLSNLLNHKKLIFIALGWIYIVYNEQISKLIELYETFYLILLHLTDIYYEKKICKGNKLKIAFWAYKTVLNMKLYVF